MSGRAVERAARSLGEAPDGVAVFAVFAVFAAIAAIVPLAAMSEFVASCVEYFAW